MRVRAREIVCVRACMMTAALARSVGIPAEHVRKVELTHPTVEQLLLPTLADAVKSLSPKFRPITDSGAPAAIGIFSKTLVMYACVRACMRPRVRASIRLSVYLCPCMHECVCAGTRVRACVCVCLCVCTYMHVRMPGRAREHQK